MGGTRFLIGSIECQVLSDGAGVYTPEQTFAGVPRDELERSLEGRLDEGGNIVAPYNCLLLRDGATLILLDAGLGEFASAWGAPAGRLQESFRAAGVDPDDIDLVIVSHGHPDHIGGLTSSIGDKRVPIFRRARHCFRKEEWEFWTAAERLAELPEPLAAAARLSLPVLAQAGLIELIEQEGDIVNGVRLLSAPGHTPGHAAVSITSGSESALYLGDAVIHELNFEHPDWVTIFETSPELVAETRRRLLDRAIAEQMLTIGYHMPFPGRVVRDGDGYRFHREG